MARSAAGADPDQAGRRSGPEKSKDKYVHVYTPQTIRRSQALGDKQCEGFEQNPKMPPLKPKFRLYRSAYAIR
jgi:hypothetical protein